MQTTVYLHAIARSLFIWESSKQCKSFIPGNSVPKHLSYYKSSIMLIQYK